MSPEPQREARGIEVRCESCGATSVMVWHPGAQCPECSSTSIAPVTKIEVGGPPPEAEAAPAPQTRQNPLVAVALAVVIVVALGFVIKSALPKKYKKPVVYWVCETCGTEFVAEAQQEPRKCPTPSCPGEAVRLVKYLCEEHNHVFDAYMTKPEPESLAKWKVAMEEQKQKGEAEGRPPMPMMPEIVVQLYKKPDGEWSKQMPEICCPQGNCDRKKLKYYKPQ